jgi:uncharacterized protein YxjI
MENNPYSHTKYLLRKQFLKLFGGTFRIFDESGGLAFFCQMKAFKLKEELTIYADEGQFKELFTIKARHIIDFSAAYDVKDSETGQVIGMLKRRGLSSLVRDEWIICDALDHPIGSIIEDSMLLALLRRLITNLVPQRFSGTVKDFEVFHFSQHFDPFVQKIDLDFGMDTQNVLDRRMGIAAAILISAIEGRQE